MCGKSRTLYAKIRAKLHSATKARILTRLAGIADQKIDFGWAEIARVDFDKLLPIESATFT